MGRGAETKDRIVSEALALASVEGLEGLSIGKLSSTLGLSKSGLFAHFGSKEELQLEVLQAAVEAFENEVAKPVLSLPRGEPRLRAFISAWMSWGGSSRFPGGCPLMAADVELDDRPGPVRDVLVKSRRDLLAFIQKAAQIAIDEGHFRPDLDLEQFSFDAFSIAAGFHHATRLLHDPKAERRMENAVKRLFDWAKTKP